MKSQSHKFMIHVVEDHHDALFRIYRDIGCKRLSYDNLTMIHFDSHSDLGIPSDLEADQVMNEERLLECLSIENWILPAVFAGHIKQVVWVKPKWALEIRVGSFNITIGENRETGKIQCNCTEPYFIGDSLYANKSNLINTQNFLLYVCDFDTIVKDCDMNLLNIIANPKDTLNKNVILDIDLDHFSVADPFKLMFKSNEEYELYKRVYAMDLPLQSDSNFESDYKVFLEKKKQKLEHIWSCLNSKEEPAEGNGTDLLLLKGLIDEYGLDAEILHSYGAGMDDCPLPHHISSDEEILTMMQQFECFLSTYLGEGPTLGCVTIARSSLDDYCPVDQVDFIQNEVLDRLKKHFGPGRIKSVDLFYENN